MWVNEILLSFAKVEEMKQGKYLRVSKEVGTCPQPAFPPLFHDKPVSRTSVIFFLKTVFFPNQWRIHGGAPVIFSPN